METEAAAAWQEPLLEYLEYLLPGKEMEGGEQLLTKLVCASTKASTVFLTVAGDEDKRAGIIKPVWAIPELEKPNSCLPRILPVPAIPGGVVIEGCLLQAGNSGFKWLY